MMPSALERAAELFVTQQRDGRTPGGVMVARKRGEIILAEAVGLANGPDAADVPVTVDTRFQVMSVSKAVVAFAIATLEDRGLLDVAAPGGALHRLQPLAGRSRLSPG